MFQSKMIGLYTDWVLILICYK